MSKHILTTTITTVALATVCACNKDARETARNAPPVDQTPITRSAPPADQQAVNSPITVTGCLQKESGLITTYIVTTLNEPSQKGVGTTGNAVEREQLREAAQAYRVDTKDKVDMDTMVGKQVRVSGTISKHADLPEPPSAAPNPSRTPGTNEAPRMEKIGKGDLAKIDEASIEVISDSCGANAERSVGTKMKSAAGKKK